MKNTLLALATTCIAVAVMTGSASATLYYFTNAAADNDFANMANWNTSADGTGGTPGAIGTSDDLVIDNNSAPDYAQISADLGFSWDEMRVGYSSGSTGELRISGGNTTILNTLRVGRNGGIGSIVFSGGTISVPNSYTTIGDGGTANVTMTGGIWNSSRQTWGQQSGDQVTLNMSGGTINLATTDPTPANTDGGLRTGAGDTFLNFTGTAVVNMQKFYIREGGLITIDGGTLNVTGTVDVNPTFNWLEANIGNLDPGTDIFGQVDYKSGALNITGDYESLFDATIANGNIYTSNFGYKVDAVYSGGSDLTTLALIALQPGDANDDGMVNLADLQILGDNWQSTTAIWSTADFTGDGVVDLADLQILGDNWGFGVGPDLSFDEALAQVAIPEPAALTLMGLALPLVLRRRKA